MHELQPSVVNPAHNEEKNLPGVLGALQAAFRKEVEK